MWNHLIVGTLKALIVKIAGRTNTKCATDVCNFHVTLSSTSKKKFELVSGNLEGPAIQFIQRIEVKKNDEFCFMN